MTMEEIKAVMNRLFNRTLTIDTVSALKIRVEGNNIYCQEDIDRNYILIFRVNNYFESTADEV